jgi:hypothetical protein
VELTPAALVRIVTAEALFSDPSNYQTVYRDYDFDMAQVPHHRSLSTCLFGNPISSGQSSHAQATRTHVFSCLNVLRVSVQAAVIPVVRSASALTALPRSGLVHARRQLKNRTAIARVAGEADHGVQSSHAMLRPCSFMHQVQGVRALIKLITHAYTGRRRISGAEISADGIASAVKAPGRHTTDHRFNGRLAQTFVRTVR